MDDVFTKKYSVEITIEDIITLTKALEAVGFSCAVLESDNPKIAGILKKCHDVFGDHICYLGESIQD